MKSPMSMFVAGCLIAGSTAMAQGSGSYGASSGELHTLQGQASIDPDQEVLSKLLNTDISVNFEDVAARDAFDYLASVIGIRVLPRYAGETGFGLDAETPIWLDAREVPALLVVEMVLEQCSTLGEDATWQLRNGALEVGTKERLNTSLKLRVYPVDELLIDIPMFGNSPSIDLNAALNGGGGGGNSGGGGGNFGGGGFGGGEGGGNSGGGFGSGSGGNDDPFTDQKDPPERVSHEVSAQELIELIMATVEPEIWFFAANIRYRNGALLVNAPDYVHRQIGGYDF